MKQSTKGNIKLPEQTLNLGLIKNKAKLLKIFFQFEVTNASNGNKMFSLVAYPAHKSKGKLIIGKKISLTIKPKAKLHELRLPLTLGNLELTHSDIKNFLNAGVSKLSFIPHLYKENPHAAYDVSGGNQLTASANPSPPARPA